jgi:hypothetical protein
VAVKRTVKPKVKPIKTIDIEVAIAKYYGVRKNIIVPNISWGFHWMHECDMFIVTKAGIATEIEIKISKSDLLADFKKGHDHKDRAGRITYFYYAMPETLYEKCKDIIPKEAGILTCERGSWEGASALDSEYHYYVFETRDKKGVLISCSNDEKIKGGYEVELYEIPEIQFRNLKQLKKLVKILKAATK